MKIAILNAGSPLIINIQKCLANLNVNSDILPLNTNPEKLKEYLGVIISGGPFSILEKSSPQLHPNFFDLNIPVLGICYGFQIIAHNFGEKIQSFNNLREGIFDIEKLKSNLLFDMSEFFFSHRDFINKLKEDSVFDILAISIDLFGKNKQQIISAIKHKHKSIFGVQFHPESVKKMDYILFKNFLNICKDNLSNNN